METSNKTSQPTNQTPANTPPQPITPKKKSKRKTFLSLLFLGLVLGGAFYTYEWYTHGRFFEETDNAYVGGNQVQIMSEVAGTVKQINADNTYFVEAGDVLVELDSTDAEQAFNKAKANLANQVRQMQQLVINSKQYSANIEQKEIDLKQANDDLNRRLSLSGSNAIGKEELQHAKDAVISAQAALKSAKEQYNANQALTLDTPIAEQPSVLNAATQLKEAWLALQRTRIVSPTSGYVSRRSVQVGAQITPNTPLMAVVPAEDLWIDANFKETQLRKMRIGQTVEVVTDLYGEDVVFQGTIQGIEMGTGSAFSLLPAQNATGNWIKIIQRVPVRIELDKEQLATHPLRIGLSSKVNVDTRDQRGGILASKKDISSLYQTNTNHFDVKEIDNLIQSIILENSVAENSQSQHSSESSTSVNSSAE